MNLPLNRDSNTGLRRGVICARLVCLLQTACISRSSSIAYALVADFVRTYPHIANHLCGWKVSEVVVNSLSDGVSTELQTHNLRKEGTHKCRRTYSGASDCIIRRPLSDDLTDCHLRHRALTALYKS